MQVLKRVVSEECEEREEQRPESSSHVPTAARMGSSLPRLRRDASAPERPRVHTGMWSGSQDTSHAGPFKAQARNLGSQGRPPLPGPWPASSSRVPNRTARPTVLHRRPTRPLTPCLLAPATLTLHPLQAAPRRKRQPPASGIPPSHPALQTHTTWACCHSRRPTWRLPTFAQASQDLQGPDPRPSSRAPSRLARQDASTAPHSSRPGFSPPLGRCVPSWSALLTLSLDLLQLGRPGARPCQLSLPGVPLSALLCSPATGQGLSAAHPARGRPSSAGPETLPPRHLHPPVL